MNIFKCMALIVLVSLALTGCATAPKPPEPKGELTPVNPVEIQVEDLKTNRAKD